MAPLRDNRSKPQPSQGARNHTLAQPQPSLAGQSNTMAGHSQPPWAEGRNMTGRGRLSGHEPAASAARGVRLDASKTARNHAQCNGRTLVSQQPRRTSSPQYTWGEYPPPRSFGDLWVPRAHTSGGWPGNHVTGSYHVVFLMFWVFPGPLSHESRKLTRTSPDSVFSPFSHVLGSNAPIGTISKRFHRYRPNLSRDPVFTRTTRFRFSNHATWSYDTV